MTTTNSFCYQNKKKTETNCKVYFSPVIIAWNDVYINQFCQTNILLVTTQNQTWYWHIRQIYNLLIYDRLYAERCTTGYLKIIFFRSFAKKKSCIKLTQSFDDKIKNNVVIIPNVIGCFCFTIEPIKNGKSNKSREIFHFSMVSIKMSLNKTIFYFVYSKITFI